MSKSTIKVLVILAFFLANPMLNPIPIAKAQENTWTTKAPMQTPRARLGVAVDGSSPYLKRRSKLK
ncbi:MAG: hypothetical protein AC479_02930 [miscellaneous Crenarchaeota group-6 archaeon AD8-1]|nr:MAG: hypothetical protein AC479_02930 [miscellaneous Crenarchaeota group-6 archaeon AD8-1]